MAAPPKIVFTKTTKLNESRYLFDLGDWELLVLLKSPGYSYNEIRLRQKETVLRPKPGDEATALVLRGLAARLSPDSISSAFHRASEGAKRAGPLCPPLHPPRHSIEHCPQPNHGKAKRTVPSKGRGRGGSRTARAKPEK